MDVYVGGGLGDSVFLALQLPLYVRRGLDITVVIDQEKAILFRACGVKIRHTRDDAPGVGWHNGDPMDQLDPAAIWNCNIPAVNFGSPPFPPIGTAAELWNELCAVHFDVRSEIPQADWDAVDAFLAPLPRPIVVLHSMGNSCAEMKNIPADLTRELYEHLLDQMPGTVLLLDWDRRVPRWPHPRVRHLMDDWEWISVPRLIALLHRADLMIGIASGPLYVAVNYTDIPVVGFYPTADHYPVRFGPPQGRIVHLVPGALPQSWNSRARVAYNLIECGSERFDMRHAASVCQAMLTEPRYLSRARLGTDVLLQQLVQFTSGQLFGPLPDNSRGHGLHLLLKAIGSRFEHPRIMVIGAVEQPERWQETGYLSYLLAILAQETDGALTIVDPDAARCQQTIAGLRGIRNAAVVCGDPIDWARKAREPIDVLFLDPSDARALDLAELPHTVRLSPQGLIGINLPCGDFFSEMNWALPLIPHWLEKGWEPLITADIQVLFRPARDSTSTFSIDIDSPCSGE